MVLLVFFLYYLVGAIPNHRLLSIWFKIDAIDLLERRPNYLMFVKLKEVLFLIALALTDFLKGIVPLYLGYLHGFSNLQLAYMVIALLLGHYFSVFNYFRGPIGMWLCIASYTAVGWSVMLVAIIIWIVGYFISGYRVVANVLVALFIPIYIYFLNATYIVPVVTLSCIIILRHASLLIRTRYGYYLPDCNGLLQRLYRDQDFLI